MKKLLSSLLIALSLIAGSAQASSSFTCNGNTYTWPDQFVNYQYVTNWPLMMGDCLAQFSAYVSAAAASATNAANSANTATMSAATQGTSTTSLTIGTGSQTLTTQTAKGFALGMEVRVAKSDGSSNWMDGNVTAYNSGTGSLTVNVTGTTGSGTISSWNIFIQGPVGPTGATGAMGAPGSPTLISTQTLSGSATPMQWTGLGSTYNNYLLIGQGFTCSSSGALYIQLGTGAGPSWTTSGYKWYGAYNYAGTLTQANNSSDSGVDLGEGIGAFTSVPVAFSITIYSIPSSSNYKEVTAQVSGFNNQGGMANLSGASTSVTTATALRINCASGNLSGTASLYGVQN